MKKKFNFTLEKATKREIPTILKMYISLADYHHKLNSYYLSGQKMMRGLKKTLEDNFQKKDSFWLVAKVGEKTVGFFSAAIQSRHATTEKRVGYICDYYLLEKYRQHNIATTATQEFIKWFKKHRIKTVELSVSADNSIGIQVWQRFGFKEYIKRLKMKI